MDCTLPGSSVHGILQARILKWVAISSSRGSSWLRDWTCVSCIAGRFFTTEPSGKPASPTWCGLKYREFTISCNWKNSDRPGVLRPGFWLSSSRILAPLADCSFILFHVGRMTISTSRSQHVCVISSRTAWRFLPTTQQKSSVSLLTRWKWSLSSREIAWCFASAWASAQP